MGNYVYNIDAKILNKASNNRTQCAINNNNKDKKSNKTSWSSRVHARKVKSKEGRHMTNSVSPVAQSCLTLCDPMDCTTPGFPVHHQLLEPAQTHVHWVGDAIQPSHPLSSQWVQLLSCVWCFVTPWTAVHQASLSITNSWSLPKFMSIESVMPSNYLILCRPLLLLSSILPIIRVFSNESVFHIRWPSYWSFSFSISPSNEHSGLISFRMDWLDLLAVQGTLKSLLQCHSSKASIL